MSHDHRRVLSVASECAPLLKTGGLADVVGALPAALAEYGWQSRILLPAYRGILDQVGHTDEVWHDEDLHGGRAVVRSGAHQGLDLLLLDAPHLFDRPGGPYTVDGHDHPDNPVRFAALSWVGAQLALHGTVEGWRPDIVHVHDWQSGLVPSYLRYAGSAVPTLLTIHNIAFQGLFGPDQLDRLRLPTWDFHPEALEYHGQVSTLKAGMVHASQVTTVSPTYAEELTTPEFGFGLEGVARMRRDRGEMTGILNGIDTTVWDPAADPAVLPYSADDPAGKAANRRALLDEFLLGEPAGPLAVVVTRLTHQKGVDLLLDALPRFVEAGGAVVVLGSGDPGYEHDLGVLASRFPTSVGVRIGYDEPLSHRMYAGGDLVLVPSRFEPCGLTQLYGLRYGAVPVVAATGGLRDTVIDATDENLANGSATGFTFGDRRLGGTVDAGGFGFALGRAVDLFADRDAWRRLRDRAMREPVDWGTSAQRYCELFDEMMR
ncbi:starch synthase [Brevibacterium sanguinis]|uniref:Glycogen synthase n=2 Tax=Brevibacterium TaxID=1696 RepID=A0A366IGV8_9MICO|nr:MULTISPECIES: glycogen synthase GlgA [Brevibacterium]RBP62544.1 starch synthase [Brevibacterium sanguinis]RBP69208.1 starch synthase [Brevibacterium celere]